LDRLKHAGGSDPIAWPGIPAANRERVVAQRAWQFELSRAGLRDIAHVDCEGIGLTCNVDAKDLERCVGQRHPHDQTSLGPAGCRREQDAIDRDASLFDCCNSSSAAAA